MIPRCPDPKSIDSQAFMATNYDSAGIFCENFVDKPRTRKDSFATPRSYSTSSPQRIRPILRWSACLESLYACPIQIEKRSQAKVMLTRSRQVDGLQCARPVPAAMATWSNEAPRSMKLNRQQSTDVPTTVLHDEERAYVLEVHGGGRRRHCNQASELSLQEPSPSLRAFRNSSGSWPRSAWPRRGASVNADLILSVIHRGSKLQRQFPPRLAQSWR